MQLSETSSRQFKISFYLKKQKILTPIHSIVLYVLLGATYNVTAYKVTT